MRRCLDAKELIVVYDNKGFNEKVKEIHQVSIFDYVRSRDESTGNDIYIPVAALHDNGEKEVYEFAFDNNTFVHCTLDHKFRTLDGQMLPIKQIMEEGLEIVFVNNY